MVNIYNSIMNNYIELNWLRKSDKDITLPLVILAEGGYSGYYLHPYKNEELINNRFYPSDKGIIVLNPEDANASTLAHEWRHHWQFWNGWENDSTIFNYNKDRRKEIIRFFTESKSEMDALLFELDKYPNEYILEWYEWLNKDTGLYISPKQIVHPICTKEVFFEFNIVNPCNNFCLPVQFL